MAELEKLCSLGPVILAKSQLYDLPLSLDAEWGGNGAATEDALIPQAHSFLASRFTFCSCVYPSSACLFLKEASLCYLCLTHTLPCSSSTHVKFCFLLEACPDYCSQVNCRQGWVDLLYIPIACCGLPSCNYFPVSLLPPSSALLLNRKLP